jgi:FkbM family methyltransferase
MKLWKMARAALTPRSRLLKTTLSNGAVVYGTNRPGYGGRGVYLYGDAVEPELQHLERFLDATGVLVDVGANTGIYTLKAAKHFGARGLVVAVEPFPEVLATLWHSVQRNGFQNVRLRNLCLDAEKGVRTLWMNEDKPNSFSIVERVAGAPGLSVLALTLDELCAWEGLERLDYLKIDAEGAEAAILAGGAQTIRRFRPIVQVEVSMRDVALDLSDYVMFQAPPHPQFENENRVLIPAEHAKIHVPAELGWARVAG